MRVQSRRVVTKPAAASARRWKEVGDALTDLGGDVVQMAFALRKHVDDLSPATVAERLCDRREPVEQVILRSSVPHSARLLFKELLDKLS